MATPVFNKAMQSSGIEIPHFSDHVQSVELIADVPAIVMVPSGYDVVSFSTTNNFYVAADPVSTPIAVPTTVTDGTSPELNPSIRALYAEGREPAVKELHLVASVGCTVTLAFYKGVSS